MENIKLEELAQGYAQALTRRNELLEEIKKINLELPEAFRLGKDKAPILRLSNLEGELSVLDGYLETNLAEQEQARADAIRQGIEDGHAALDEAEAKQARLVAEIDAIIPILEKNGRALLDLRRKTLDRVINVTITGTERGDSLMRRKETIGAMGWQVKRFLMQYLTLRGKRHFNDPIPRWGEADE